MDEGVGVPVMQLDSDLSFSVRGQRLRAWQNERKQVVRAPSPPPSEVSRAEAGVIVPFCDQTLSGDDRHRSEPSACSRAVYSLPRNCGEGQCAAQDALAAAMRLCWEHARQQMCTRNEGQHQQTQTRAEEDRTHWVNVRAGGMARVGWEGSEQSQRTQRTQRVFGGSGSRGAWAHV
jgi:hypothetical protein